jgi:esterase/lipase superfamily enzyme
MHKGSFSAPGFRALDVTARSRSSTEYAMNSISLVACVVALLLSGCAGSPPRSLDLMPAPAAYEQSEKPFGPAATTTPDGLGALDMLYATNRAPAAAGYQGEERYYSGERGYLVRVGSADINFGDSDITWDEAREISLLKNRPGSFPLKVRGIQEAGILASSVSVFTPEEIAATVDDRPSRDFVRELENRLARSPVKDIFIYVHGYKVNFENPLLVAAEMWHFLGHEGAFIAFSWPSTPARLAYMKDIETARVSAWGLRQFLDFLARETSAERIHIVAYSAGTRVVLTTLYELALIHQRDSEAEARNATRLGNVILVGSDVDTGTFASYIIDGLLRVQDHLSIYTSPSDKALHLSEKIFAHRRVGEILPGTLDERMRQFAASSSQFALIDVADADHFDDGNGHAYFRTSPWVSSDILMTLRYGLAPAERGLEQRGDSPVWRFPHDYLSRFESALAQATATRRATDEQDMPSTQPVAD